MPERATTLNTKRMLAAGLREAMRAKPLSKVTVSELVAATGVNRKTFYYHFVDIPDLLVWTLDDEAIGHLPDLELPVQLEQSIDFVLRYIDENRPFLRNALDALGQEKMRALLHDDVARIVDVVVADGGSAHPSGVAHVDFLRHFATEVLAALLIDQIHGRGLDDRRALVHFITMTLRGMAPGVGQGPDQDTASASSPRP